MLIAEFCRFTQLTRDAVRLYVKLGLLQPKMDARGSNRYQHFEQGDVERMAVVRTAQLLGFTLKQIVAFNREYEAGALDTARKIALMRDQLAQVEAKAERVLAMRQYLRSKVAWLEAGEVGPEPGFLGPQGHCP